MTISQKTGHLQDSITRTKHFTNFPLMLKEKIMKKSIMLYLLGVGEFELITNFEWLNI